LKEPAHVQEKEKEERGKRKDKRMSFRIKKQKSKKDQSFCHLGNLLGEY